MPALFSDRTQWSFDTNNLNQCLNTLKQEGKSVIDLTVSNPTVCDIPYPQQELLQELASKEYLSYCPDPQGLLSARTAIARYYEERGSVVSPEQLYLTASTSEAYVYLFKLLANPNEEILFPQPSYPLFHFLADFCDVRLVFYKLKYAQGAWRVDFKDLRNKMSPRTKAIVTVNPNNPTGSFIKTDEQKEILKLCAARHMAIISDEVFWDYCFLNGGDRKSFMNQKECLTFVLGGLSKAMALPQMKVSWMAVSGPVNQMRDAQQRLDIIADTFLSVNTPAQGSLSSWLPQAQAIQGAMCQRLTENLETLVSVMSQAQGFHVLKPEGGWYAIIQHAGISTEEEYVLNLLRTEGVLVHPGYFYDFEHEGFLVVSLLPPPHAFREGIERLARYHRLQGYA